MTGRAARPAGEGRQVAVRPVGRRRLGRWRARRPAAVRAAAARRRVSGGVGRRPSAVARAAAQRAARAAAPRRLVERRPSGGRPPRQAAAPGPPAARAAASGGARRCGERCWHSRRAPARGSAADLRAASRRCGGAKDRIKRRDCVLRATVANASRCLDDLSAGQRRVLTLRAGSRSRRGVARRLDITVRRVARLERTGLARLRALTKQRRLFRRRSQPSRRRASPPRRRTRPRRSSRAPSASRGATRATRPPATRAAAETARPRAASHRPRAAAACWHHPDQPGRRLRPHVPADPARARGLLRRCWRGPSAVRSPPLPSTSPRHRSGSRGGARTCRARAGTTRARPQDSESEWSGEPQAAAVAPHEEWTPPVRRTPTRRD